MTLLSSRYPQARSQSERLMRFARSSMTPISSVASQRITVWATSMRWEPSRPTALAIATVPVAPEEKMEQLLEELLTGAVEALNEAGAALVGGHTKEGVRDGAWFGAQRSRGAKPIATQDWYATGRPADSDEADRDRGRCSLPTCGSGRRGDGSTRRSAR